MLENLKFSLKHGEIVAIVGSNRGGKSTLVKILLGLFNPSYGEVFLNNMNINTIDENEQSRCIGIAFQDFIKYKLSLRDNVGFGDIANINNDDGFTHWMGNS